MTHRPLSRGSPLLALFACLLFCGNFVTGALVINTSVFDSSALGFQLAGSAAFTHSQFDACGVCAGNGSTCAGCDGQPNSGAVRDACGVCRQRGDPQVNSTCLGCDKVPNSGATYDACGVCRLPGDAAANSTCAGCDGVPNSNTTVGACGVCRRPKDPAANSTCAGCDGVPNSGAVFDPCCVCKGNATYFSACYLALTANGLPQAFDPNKQGATWASFFSAAGQAVYDQCGECQGWKYNNSECAGCDGVPMSGTVFDSCGQCGGNCSTCTTGCGALGCKLQARTSGPGINGAPLYTPQNKPGIPVWAQTAANIAQCIDAVRPNYVVLLFGLEFGPYTLLQLQTGVLNVTDPRTQQQVLMPLAPSTLIGVLNFSNLNETLVYGATSALPTRASDWANAAASKTDVIQVTTGTLVPNTIVLSVPITTLVGGNYTPVASIPELRGVAYPPCTGVSFRSGSQQTHGKWTGLNPRGLIVSAGVTDTANALTNQAWNPDSQFIGDVATSWSDVQCSCHNSWDMTIGPTPPTCLRLWLQSPPNIALSRSAAAGSRGGLLTTQGASGGGGFTMIDGGGELLGRGASSQPSRRPWRVSSIGELRRSGLVHADPLGLDPPLCRPAARLVPPEALTAGALWAIGATVPLAGGNVSFAINFSFQFSQAARACADVATLSRGMSSEEAQRHSYSSCVAARGEGLALVFLDQAAAPTATVIGAGGSAIGYGGLRNSLAVEFDAHGNVSAGEPANIHVAVMSAGAAPNSELHYISALASTDAVPPFTDSHIHTAAITFVAQPTSAALAAGLATGGSFRGSGKGGRVLTAALAGWGSPGLLQGALWKGSVFVCSSLFR